MFKWLEHDLEIENQRACKLLLVYPCTGDLLFTWQSQIEKEKAHQLVLSIGDREGLALLFDRNKSLTWRYFYCSMIKNKSTVIHP